MNNNRNSNNNNKNRSNNKGRKNYKKRPNQGQSKNAKPNKGQGSSGEGQKKRNNNKRRFNNRRGGNRGQKATTTSKYLNLWSIYQQARQKYFDLFDRAQDNQRVKLENKYYQALKNLREFEEKLPPEDLEQFIQFTKKRDDNTYSDNHELAPVPESVNFIGDFEDPHLLQTQHSSNFSEDTEESVGSMEDYLNYKA